MPWTTPSFEEIKMDAEARSYGGWVSDLETPVDGPAAVEQRAATEEQELASADE